MSLVTRASKPPLDERLRDAFRAAAGTIQPGSIQPGVQTGTQARVPSFPRRRLAMFAPLAAAATVVLAIGGSMALSHLDPVADHAAGQTAIPPVPGSGQPPFVLMQDLNQPHNPGYEVRSAVTGQLTATIDPPRPGTRWLGATGSGTGRAFVLTAGPGTASGINSADTCRWYSYTLRLTAAGTVGSLTSLSVPGTPDDGSMRISTPVLSADGSTLAYAATRCSNIVHQSYPYTIVVAVRGIVHRYAVTVPGGMRGAATIDSLSLSANGSELGYVIDDVTFSYPTAPGGAWVLPTSAASGPAAQRAHEILTDNTRHGPWMNAIVLSSDGSTGYVLARTGGPYTLDYTLTAYNIRAGALIRVLHTWHGLPFQTGTEVVGGGHALIWGWDPNQATEADLVTGAAGTYLPRALAKVAASGLAW